MVWCKVEFHISENAWFSARSILPYCLVWVQEILDPDVHVIPISWLYSAIVVTRILDVNVHPPDLMVCSFVSVNSLLVIHFNLVYLHYLVRRNSYLQYNYPLVTHFERIYIVASLISLFRYHPDDAKAAFFHRVRNVRCLRRPHHDVLRDILAYLELLVLVALWSN